MLTARLSKSTVAQRLTVLAVVAVIGPLALITIAYRIIAAVKVSGPLYADIVRGKDLVADILPPPEYILESYLVVHEAAGETRAEVRQRHLEHLKQLHTDYQIRHDFWADDLPDGEMKRTLLMDSYTPAQRFYQIVEREFIPAVQSGDLTRATVLVKGPLFEAYEQHRTAIDRVVVQANQFAGDAEARSNRRLRSSLQLLFGASGGIVLAVIGLSLLIGRGVVGPLRRVADVIRTGSHEIVSAAGQVATSAQSLSQGASEQAATLEETSASMSAMASMTSRNAENATHAATLVASVSRQMIDAQTALHRMVESMSAINDSSHKVAKIIKTIDGIAFQTNILALNAAVEAARAGEAGLGFAVVADEVRSLAHRSAQAAKGTAELIEESIARSERGDGHVQQLAAAIGAITESVSQVSRIVAEVRDASQQQTQGIDQVSQAIAQMEQVTQMTAATAEESAAASEELNAQAETSIAEVRELEALVARANHAEPPMRPPTRNPRPLAGAVVTIRARRPWAAPCPNG